jgi:hypothetical protein
MSISAISASSPSAALISTTPASPLATIAPNATAPQLTTPLNPATTAPVPPPLTQPASSLTPSAAATSTTIAQTYGFAPSLIVPLAQILTYQPIYANPSLVSGVTEIALLPRTSEHPRHLFDQLA